MRAIVCAALLLAAAPSTARAAEGDDLEIMVLTMGPGDHPFFKFGHNAIWVQPRDRPGRVYNWGTFDFDSPTLILDFLKGRLTYWLSVSSVEESLYPYQATNRSLEVQELDLTPAQKAAMARRLEDNARPENRAYLYDYFWDNCSTRVRDAVDVAVGGQVKAQAGARPAGMTYRHQALRLTADLLWEYVGLHLGLGRPTDRLPTRWEESFIPMAFRDELRQIKIRDERGERPLVKRERVLFAAPTRPPALAAAPARAPWFALAGVALGGGLFALGHAARRTRPEQAAPRASRDAARRRAARIALGTGGALLGLLFGFLGLALAFLWTFTNHKAAHANANLWQTPPFVLALLAFPVGVARARPWALRGALALALGAAVASAIGVLAKLFPGVSQDNTSFIVFFLPLWAGLAAGLWRARGSSSP
jgi:hypothetical protein